MIYIIFKTLFTMLDILRILTLASIFMSWIMPRSAVLMKLDWFLSPFVAPFRWLNMKITARSRLPLDFSYMFLLIGISVVRSLLYELMYFLIF